MAERETCLVVLASTWFEVIGESPAPELADYEYKLRCRIVVDGPQVVLAHIYELADTSGRFERRTFGLRQIPRSKILREEAWERPIHYRGRTIEPQSYLSDGGRWRPQATIVTHDGGSVQTKRIWAPLEVTFSTEAEANAYAVVMAKKWIDEHG